MLDLVSIDWLITLKKRGFFTNRNSILELGPQDISPQINPEVLLRRFKNFLDCDFQVNKIYKDKDFIKGAQIFFYKSLGLDNYHSFDIADTTSSTKVDLNEPLRNFNKKFDIITNFGTAEHVFNIGQVFKTIDELISDNGLVLHILPTFGDINHGFWNIHPTVYYDLSRKNNYEILDFRYVDHSDTYREHISSNKEIIFDFDKLPISINFNYNHIPFEMINKSFREKVVLNFNKNFNSELAKQAWMNRTDIEDTVVFDYCFVALRKIQTYQNRIFQWPGQSKYDCPEHQFRI